ncbi:MAG: hypothetical protein M1426_03360 [Patescibacteria group bacterium]|nr:hypothetical protein [Patescibacteria group bacterium]
MPTFEGFVKNLYKQYFHCCGSAEAPSGSNVWSVPEISSAGHEIHLGLSQGLTNFLDDSMAKAG